MNFSSNDTLKLSTQLLGHAKKYHNVYRISNEIIPEDVLALQIQFAYAKMINWA